MISRWKIVFEDKNELFSKKGYSQSKLFNVYPIKIILSLVPVHIGQWLNMYLVSQSGSYLQVYSNYVNVF